MTSVKKELIQYGVIPRKRWGQHFLIDKNILNKVIQTAQIDQEDVVLEVGPGMGEMTLSLARQAKKVIAIEIDPKMVEILKKKVAGNAKVEVIEGDILALDFKNYFSGQKPLLKVVANLPYQISTPLLFQFIESRELFSTLTLMLQKEVAERMVATPGNKTYGPLSIFIQLFSDPSICFFIKPSAFFPPPKVESAVVHMILNQKPKIKLNDERWFKKVVRGCFSYRRKTLMNALKHADLFLSSNLEQRMEKIGLDPRRRPETLTLEEFANLANLLN